MLRNTNELKDYSIQASDGTIGHVKDFYFDDAAWVIRYVVVDTGSWLSSRKVLVSPMAVTQPNWAEKSLRVSMTKEQVKNSPDVDTEKPVSRQHEIQYLTYYNYPYYWGGSGLWGGEMYPGMMLPGYGGLLETPQARRAESDEEYARAQAALSEDDNPHLRSCNEVKGYHIHASDGDIGHVQGLLVDEQSWAIRYMVVDTSNWWLGHTVLIAPPWVKEVSWSDSSVSIDLTRQAVKDAPPYDPADHLSREQETGIHGHYGRAGYWADHEV